MELAKLDAEFCSPPVRGGDVPSMGWWEYRPGLRRPRSRRHQHKTRRNQTPRFGDGEYLVLTEIQKWGSEANLPYVNYYGKR